MFTRPTDLADVAVAGALERGWGLVADDVAYAAVGFGSHHWHAVCGGVRWFVTVDDLDARRRDEREARDGAAERLRAALHAARALRAGGLRFVVAPQPTRTGDVLVRLDGRWAVAVYEHVDGETAGWGPYDTGAQRRAVLERLVAIHRSSAAAAPVARIDDFAIPRRDALSDALANGIAAWGPGPFAAPAGQLLNEHRDAVVDVLARYDALVSRVAHQPQRFVITHGEPHRANTIVTDDGVVLIDWDTALMAPPERDLWMLIGEDPGIADDYLERTGTAVDPESVEMYRLCWDLCEIALYVADFGVGHTDTEDTRTAWDGLREHLDPTRWHDTADRPTPITEGSSS